MTCIYCASNGPFTDEHVIPAGLGGDDKAWVLKGMVCGVCNTEAFSKLELKVMRASPLGIARLFRQPKTRLRGSKTGKPTIQTAASYFDDPELGVLLEQEFSGGQPVILPQIVAHPPGTLTVTASDVAGANALINTLRDFADTTSIIEKTPDGAEVRFTETPLEWIGDKYQIGKAESHVKAPKGGIWLQPLRHPANKTTSVLAPRVFRQANGSLACRAKDIEQAVALLTIVRHHYLQITVPDSTVPRSFDKPNIHLQQVMDICAEDRVLTKIGLNLCAHLFGADAVRTPVFDRARRYARYDDGAIKKWPRAVADSHADLYPPLPHHHLIVISTSAPTEENPGFLSALMRFYDGPVECLILAEGTEGIPRCPEPIVILNDFENHKIMRLSLEAFCNFAIRSRSPSQA